MLKKDHITDLKGINRFGERNVNAIRKMATHHIIILAKNDIGRYNLYQLISESHMTYYGRRPRIPKSLLNEHREGWSSEVHVKQVSCIRQSWKKDRQKPLRNLRTFMIIMRSSRSVITGL